MFCQIKVMFSKACEYGIRALLFVAGESRKGRKTGLREIAAEIGSPPAFTAKVLQQLVKQELLESVKGPHGGFRIPEEKADQITLDKVVFAIDGDQVYRGCGLGLPQCSESNPCPVHEEFALVRNKLRHMLETTTLGDLTDKLMEGNAVLKRG